MTNCEREIPLRRQAGFSLIEMLIATVILSVSILALTSITITAMRVNLENDLRNAAVRLSSEVAEDLRHRPFDSVDDDSTSRNLTIRGGTQAFQVVTNVEQITDSLRQVEIEVSYTHQGKTSSISSVIYKQRSI